MCIFAREKYIFTFVRETQLEKAKDQSGSADSSSGSRF